MGSSASSTDSAARASARSAEARRHPGELHGLVTGEPAFVVANDMHVTSWNRALERLTGVSAADAVGRPCYAVMSAISHGAPPSCCRYGCPLMRATLRGWPSDRFGFSIATVAGPVYGELGTVGGESELMHLVLAPPAGGGCGPEAVADRTGRAAALTPRQTDVLRLLTAGVACQGISRRLVISTATTRNHIRAILRALGAHSQLEAVSEARRRGLV